MAFNLKEYILFRTEIKRELFNEEVDRNFQAVANPWTNYRRYEIGDVVYHPVIVESTTGEAPTTGEPEEFLVWWRANKRTTLGTFIMTQWDIIGGVGGFTNITIAGTDSFGNVLANWNAPMALPWNMAFDGDISANSPGDTLKITAGTGISIGWNQAELAFIINNTGALGEIDEGLNIGAGVGEDVYTGMTGVAPNRFLNLKGFTFTNTLPSSAALSISTIGGININYDFDAGLINLGDLNLGCPTLDLLCDVTYISGTPTAGDLLQWSGSEWENIPISLIGSRNIYDNSDTIIAPSRDVTLNAGAGRLYFQGNGAFAAPGFGLNNTGMAFTMGENATTLNRLLTLNANDALVYQVDLNNAGAGSASIHYQHTGGDYLAGMNVATASPSFTITEGTTFNGLNTDDFSVEGGNIWIPDWAPTGASILNQHYIPFANDDAANTGLTKTQGGVDGEAGLMWTYDGTDGKNSNTGTLFINRASVPPTSKAGISIQNVPEEEVSEENYAIWAVASPNPSPATATENSATLLSGFTFADYPFTLSSWTRLGRFDQLNREQYGLFSTMVGGAEVDKSVGVGILSNAIAPQQIGLGSINQTTAVLTDAFGVYSDMINTYSSTGYQEITDTGIWAGFFRGCVNITEGGLVLGESAIMPDCNIVTGDNIEERTLWINSADGHLYRGNVDVEAGSGVTMCAISDVDCTGLADGYILTYDAGSTDWIVGPNVSTLDSLCNLVDVDCITPGPQDGEILVYNGGTDMWENVTTGSLGLGNIYTQDGTQTDPIRTYTGLGLGSQLKFENIGTYSTSAERSSHDSQSAQYEIDAATYFGVTAGSYIQMDAATNFNVATTNGHIVLQSQGAAANLAMTSDNQVTILANSFINLATSIADINLNAADQVITSSVNSTVINAGSSISLQATLDAIMYSTTGNVDIDAILGDVTIDAPEGAILLTANTNFVPNRISLQVGSDATDYISIETMGWSSGIAPTATSTHGPPLMRWENAGAVQTTDYAMWGLPWGIGTNGYILQMNTGTGNAEWVDPSILSALTICGYDIDCPTGAPDDGDFLMFNGTTLQWDITATPPGITTIYTGNSALTGSRTVDLNGFKLLFGDISGIGPILDINPFSGHIGFGDVGGGTGYKFPLTQGTVGQILALTAPNQVGWVDDSVFTLCDAPVDCPTGGPADGDGLFYSSSTGMWEITPGLCCNLQDTMDAGSVAIGLTTDVQIVTSGEILLTSTNDEINITAVQNVKIESVTADVNIITTAGDITLTSSNEVQITCNTSQVPNVGDYLTSKDTNGTLQWSPLSICGFDVDCSTPGPQGGDTLVFNDSTLAWDLGNSCCTLQSTWDEGTTAGPLSVEWVWANNPQMVIQQVGDTKLGDDVTDWQAMLILSGESPITSQAMQQGTAILQTYAPDVTGRDDQAGGIMLWSTRAGDGSNDQTSTHYLLGGNQYLSGNGFIGTKVQESGGVDTSTRISGLYLGGDGTNMNVVSQHLTEGYAEIIAQDFCTGMSCTLAPAFQYNNICNIILDAQAGGDEHVQIQAQDAITGVEATITVKVDGNIQFDGAGLGNPTVGDFLIAKDSNGNVEWGAGEISLLCGFDIDCPTGSPGDGDTLIFNSATNTWDIGTSGFWEEGSALIDILGNHTVLNPLSTDNSIIAGGMDNTLDGSRWSVIAGGWDHTISGGSNLSAIIGGFDNAITSSTLKSAIIGGELHTIDTAGNSVIAGGFDNDISGGSAWSAIIGGETNVISAGVRSAIIAGIDNVNNHARTVILGGTGIISAADDFVYVPSLNINTVGVTAAVTNLAVDASGNVVAATGGGNGIYGGSGTVPAATVADIDGTLVFAKGVGAGTIEIEEAVGIGVGPDALINLNIQSDGVTDTNGIFVEMPTHSPQTTTNTTAIFARNRKDHTASLFKQAVGIDGRSVPLAPNTNATYVGVKGIYSTGDISNVRPNECIGIYGQAGDENLVGGIGSSSVGVLGQVGRSVKHAYGLRVVYGGSNWTAPAAAAVGGDLYGISAVMIADTSASESVGGNMIGGQIGVQSKVDFGGDLIGIDVKASKYSGDGGLTATNIGIHISELGNTGALGAITDAYALLIEPIEDASSGVVNKFGIVQEGEEDQNQFFGEVTLKRGLGGATNKLLFEDISAGFTTSFEAGMQAADIEYILPITPGAAGRGTNK